MKLQFLAHHHNFRPEDCRLYLTSWLFFFSIIQLCMYHEHPMWAQEELIFFLEDKSFLNFCFFQTINPHAVAAFIVAHVRWGYVYEACQYYLPHDVYVRFEVCHDVTKLRTLINAFTQKQRAAPSLLLGPFNASVSTSYANSSETTHGIEGETYWAEISHLEMSIWFGPLTSRNILTCDKCWFQICMNFC